MRAIAWHPDNRLIDLGWAAFAAVNALAMLRFERWETIPFHFIWVSLTLVYGLQVWRVTTTAIVLAGVMAVTGSLLVLDVSEGTQDWSELTEVPLMSAMFAAMVWHARRHKQALGAVERLAAERASLLEHEERFVQDASHELRTPVTVARGHLELLARSSPAPEIDVALEELQRMERLVGGLLLLARSDRADFLVRQPVLADAFLESIFMRWAEAAPRAWRLGELDCGVLEADPDALRCALDALLHNAVEHAGERAAIELRSHARGGRLVIEVADDGAGIPPDAAPHVFERFARADPTRRRDGGGAGLGLAIVAAIAKAHDGSCSVATSPAGTVFSFELPRFSRLPPPALEELRVPQPAVS
jgi:signal transduction histidine kinase